MVRGQSVKACMIRVYWLAACVACLSSLLSLAPARSSVVHQGNVKTQLKGAIYAQGWRDRSLFGKDMPEYHSTFNTMDVDGSGRLTFSEFDAAFQRLDIIVAPELLMEIFQACDADKNGTVDYREFVQEFVTRHEQNAAAVAARQQARQQPLAAPLSTATVTTTSSTSTVEAAVMEPPPAEKHLRDALARVGFGAPSERASNNPTI